MLKWASILALIAAVLGALMLFGVTSGPTQAPGILLVAVMLVIALALVARETVYKKMK